MHAPSFVGAATRGECRLVATSKAKASARGRASHKNSARALICGSRDPRRTQTRSHLKSKSFAPGSGLPRKQCTRPHLWEPRPAVKADSQPPEKQKRPEDGPPTKTVHAPFCGSRDPRRRQTRSHLKSKSFAPRSGLLRKQCTRPHFVGGATRGECRLAATSLKSESFGPRSGLPQNSARAFICGSRDPRRMQTRSHLKSKSFGPRSGLLHGVQPAPSQFMEGTQSR